MDTPRPSPPSAHSILTGAGDMLQAGELYRDYYTRQNPRRVTNRLVLEALGSHVALEPLDVAA